MQKNVSHQSAFTAAVLGLRGMSVIFCPPLPLSPPVQPPILDPWSQLPNLAGPIHYLGSELK